jgi:hypothetical protein
MCFVPMADDMTCIDGSEDFLNFLSAERGRLAFGPREFGRLNFPGRVDRQDAFLGQPGKHHPDGGHVLGCRKAQWRGRLSIDQVLAVS